MSEWDQLYKRMACLDGADAEEAFAEFFEAATPLVRKRFLQWDCTQAVAEALAFAFVREIALMAPFAGEEVGRLGFEAWIESVTRDTFLLYWKRRSRLALPQGDWLDVAEQLEMAMKRLAPLQRSLLWLFDSPDGPGSYEEAARILGIPPEEAEAQHREALRGLEAGLSRPAKMLFRGYFRR